MIHYLRYCCAMFFALFGFLLATPLSAQAQTREAYVAQSADKTTLTFYYDALRATRTGTTWGIEETKSVILDGTFPAWAGTSQEEDTTTARVVFDASFRDFRPTTTAKWFYDCNALKQIEGLEYLNTSEVKDMSRMFWGCSALTSLDLKHFNTQNVTNMECMFRRCSALTSLDLKSFNTQGQTTRSNRDIEGPEKNSQKGDEIFCAFLCADTTRHRGMLSFAGTILLHGMERLLSDM